MKTNQLSVHVATTTRKVGEKVYHSHLLRHSFREDGKVRNVTLANLFHVCRDTVIDAIRLGPQGAGCGPCGAFLRDDGIAPPTVMLQPWWGR